MPVAFDLDRDAHGKVIAGLETKTACDKAMSLSAFYSPSDSVIVVTAGEAGDDWDRVWVARIMADYIESRDDAYRIIVEKGFKFGMSGEMSGLTKIVSEVFSCKNIEIILVAKWWYALRARFLCRYWLNDRGAKNIPISVVTCQSFVGWRTVAEEFFCTWPKSLLYWSLGMI